MLYDDVPNSPYTTHSHTTMHSYASHSARKLGCEYMNDSIDQKKL